MRREMKHPMIGLHLGSSQTDSLAVNSGIRQMLARVKAYWSTTRDTALQPGILPDGGIGYAEFSSRRQVSRAR